MTDQGPGQPAPARDDQRAEPPREEHPGHRPGPGPPDLLQGQGRAGRGVHRPADRPVRRHIDPDPHRLARGGHGPAGPGQPGRRMSTGSTAPDPRWPWPRTRPWACLGMVFHELATNSAKYGALSVPAGRVALSWRLDPVTDTLAFAWREVGGPPVTPPKATGFGTRLIERSIAGELRGPDRRRLRRGRPRRAVRDAAGAGFRLECDSRKWTPVPATVALRDQVRKTVRARCSSSMMVLASRMRPSAIMARASSIVGSSTSMSSPSSG
jgi:hypothetical protein